MARSCLRRKHARILCRKGHGHPAFRQARFLSAVFMCYLLIENDSGCLAVTPGSKKPDVSSPENSNAALLAGSMLAAWPVLAADVTPERLLNPDKEPQNWLMNHRTYDGQRFSPL